MKGRYQLPTFAKFNRPDPMRDWDWLRPNTVNLYQYCGNDPINAWDPNGFGVVSIKLATAGKNKVDVSRFPILKTLASPNPQQLGFKDEEYHKNYLINIQAQLEPGDDPADFVVEQSAIASSNDGITSALEGEDSPEDYAVAYDSSTQILSMVDSPGLSEVGFGHGANPIESDDYVAVFSTTAKEKEKDEGKTVYWQVIIQVDDRGNTTFHSAEEIDQETFEMMRDGFERSKKTQPEDP